MEAASGSFKQTKFTLRPQARRIFHWCPQQRDEWGTDFSGGHQKNGWVTPKLFSSINISKNMEEARFERANYIEI